MSGMNKSVPRFKSEHEFRKWKEEHDILGSYTHGWCIVEDIKPDSALISLRMSQLNAIKLSIRTHRWAKPHIHTYISTNGSVPITKEDIDFMSSMIDPLTDDLLRTFRVCELDCSDKERRNYLARRDIYRW